MIDFFWLMTGSAPWIYPVMHYICKWNANPQWSNTHTTHNLHRNPIPRWGLSMWQPNQRRGRGGAIWCYNYNHTVWASKQEWIFQSGELHGYLWWEPGTPTGTGRHAYRTLHTRTQHTQAARILHLPITDATIITSVSLRKCCQPLCSLIYCTRFTISV